MLLLITSSNNIKAGDLEVTGKTTLGNTTIDNLVVTGVTGLNSVTTNTLFTFGVTTTGGLISSGKTILNETTSNTLHVNGSLTSGSISSPTGDFGTTTTNDLDLHGIVVRNDNSVSESSSFFVVTSPPIPVTNIAFPSYTTTGSFSVGIFPPFNSGTMTLTGQSGMLGMSVTIMNVPGLSNCHVEIWKNGLGILADTVGPSGLSSFNSSFFIPVVSTDTSLSLHIWSSPLITVLAVNISLMNL